MSRNKVHQLSLCLLLSLAVCDVFPTSAHAQHVENQESVPVAGGPVSVPALPSAPSETGIAAASPPAGQETLPLAATTESVLEMTLRAPPGVALVTRRVEPKGRRGERQCMGDCSMSLPPGPYRLALAYGLNLEVDAPGTFHLHGPDVLEAQYTSARKQRILGGILMGVGVPLGVALLTDGLRTNAALDQVCTGDVCRDEKLKTGPKLSIAMGVVITVAAAALGGWLVTRKDRARVQLRGTAHENRWERDLPPAPPPAAPKVATAPATHTPEPSPAVLEQVAPDRSVTESPSDAKVLSSRGAALLRCFPEPPETGFELKLTIDEGGRARRLAPSVPLAASVAKCLSAELKSARFHRGEERSLRFRLSGKPRAPNG